MRKKLKDKDAELADCRAEIQQREKELVVKERIIAERDGVVDELQRQISQLNAALHTSVDNSRSTLSSLALTVNTEVCNYTLRHKKHAALFLTVTLSFIEQLLRRQK